MKRTHLRSRRIGMFALLFSSVGPIVAQSPDAGAPADTLLESPCPDEIRSVVSVFPADTVKSDTLSVFCGSPDTLAADTLSPVVAADTAVRKRSFFQKFLDYFADANKNKKNKKFDFSIIGGPHYSSDTKLGLGLVAAGIYRTDRNDTLTSPSNISLYGDVSTTGFYLLGVRGNNLFPQDKYRLSYNLYFFSFPGYYWGVGYAAGASKANKTKFLRIQNLVKVNFQFRLAKDMYLGPNVSFDYVLGKDFKRPEVLNGEKKEILTTGLGVSYSYDSRDYLTNAFKGWFFELDQRIYPNFLGNKRAFTRTEIKLDYYCPVWKGGILAFDFHSQLNYGDVPWSMMATLGGSTRMRGYYDGQYRDKNITEVQVELRQHVWKRNGVAVWVGAGNVYPDFKAFQWKHTLPNYGVGYRWEFKKRVNVRLDYGFGKGTSAFIFNINEAF